MAAATALAAFGIAGERAAARAAGPGSFKVALFDEMAAFEPADLKTEAKVTTV
jgi:Hydroxyethylthiazole kinase, sugar kinase family